MNAPFLLSPCTRLPAQKLLPIVARDHLIVFISPANEIRSVVDAGMAAVVICPGENSALSIGVSTFIKQEAEWYGYDGPDQVQDRM